MANYVESKLVTLAFMARSVCPLPMLPFSSRPADPQILVVTSWFLPGGLLPSNLRAFIHAVLSVQTVLPRHLHLQPFSSKTHYSVTVFSTSPPTLTLARLWRTWLLPPYRIYFIPSSCPTFYNL